MGQGALQNLIGGGGGLKSIHGGSMGDLKMLLKNTCEGFYLIIKLPASLQTKVLNNSCNHFVYNFYP